jgi:hypothetical protein
METIEQKLEPLEGYFLSFKRDTMNGWYEVEIGLPTGWVFSDSKEIMCEILSENEVGKIILVKPKITSISADDLVAYIETILSTNKKIEQKEKELNERLNEMKKAMEAEASKFYKELESLKDDSLNTLKNPESIKKETKQKRNKIEQILDSRIENNDDKKEE